MKKISFVLVLLVLLTMPVLVSVAQSAYVMVAEGQVNVRTGPGIQYPIMRQVYYGEIYAVIDRSAVGNWLLLDLGDTRGWIFRLLTTDTLPASGSVVDTSAGQGGGGEAATVSGMGLGTVITIEEFNRTIGTLGNVRMRLGPGLNYRILTVAPDGARLLPLARSRSGSWIFVEYEGMRGWVSSRYVAAPPAINLALLPVQG